MRVRWNRPTVEHGGLKTPHGVVTIVCGPKGVLKIELPGERKVRVDPAAIAKKAKLDLPIEEGGDRIERVRDELTEYFEGRRRKFRLPLAPQGTPFQHAVWDAVYAIGFGETTSYGAIAKAIGRPTAFRAVGAANGQNPIPIVIPCHRIVGSAGHLTGFGGGLPLKAALLAHEGIGVSNLRQEQFAYGASTT